jgi:hypothetical protein
MKGEMHNSLKGGWGKGKGKGNDKGGMSPNNVNIFSNTS